MKKEFVKDFEIGQSVLTPLAVYDKRLNQFTNRSGQPAYGLMLSVGDRSGRISAINWNAAQELHQRVGIDQIWLVGGKVQEYRGSLQLVVEQILPAPTAQVDLADYLPESGFDREVLWRRLQSVMQSIGNSHLRALLQQVFTPERRQSFCTAPAGRGVHHAYVGGLLEHTLEVVSYAEAMVSEQGMYLNRDLLLTGCVLHDIGKIEEYDLASLSFQMTDRGKMIGHLQMGSQLVGELASGLEQFPEELLLELQHMILAHHGVPEWGSPQQPRSINAMALHLADLTSGRLAQIGRIISDHRAENGHWTNYDKFLERNFFVPSELLE
ncbi:MAG: 3'-5' exoribonuclease YhaM family protein [Bacillota bacterium]